MRGEALPYKTIKELRVERGRRRTTLHLVRSEDIQLSLVLWDAYAGRLQPARRVERTIGRARLEVRTIGALPEYFWGEWLSRK